MASDLVVPEGTNVVLDANPPQQFSGALQRVKIKALQDLVDAHLVSSRGVLDQLLEGAKTATSAAVRRPETYTQKVRVHGTGQPDLRRFGEFRAAAPEAHPAEAGIFWRIVRDIQPGQLANVNQVTDLGGVSAVDPRFTEWVTYLFRDVDIQANAVLTLDGSIALFRCRNLTIRTSGQIVIRASDMAIEAFSIQGNM